MSKYCKKCKKGKLNFFDGASDTQSREEIVNFIKKRLDEGGFI
jgi:hypothetical protein